MANSDLGRHRHAMYAMRDFTRERRASKDAWWFEGKGGIEVIVYKGNVQIGYRASSYMIPWRDVRRALARKDRP